MTSLAKKSLAIYSLTSCGGCQFEFLSHYDKLAELLSFYDLEQFRLAEEKNEICAIDVTIIEGSPEEEYQTEKLKKIRANSKIVVAIGACAHLGGVQSQRNYLSKKLINKKDVSSLHDIIRIDYTIPGCPINQDELVRCLIDVYFDKIFTLPDLAVCFECKQNENKCLIKKGKPCLGPITRAGCDSICTNNAETCLGCRGPIEQANFIKIKNILKPMLNDDDLLNKFNFYGDYEKNHGELIKKGDE